MRLVPTKTSFGSNEGAIALALVGPPSSLAAVVAPGVHWVFDALPPSGARRGGDPSEHAFKHDVETLVREVVQNANDQALGFPAISFRVRELRGEALSRFYDAIDWYTLSPHLRAAAAARGGRALASYLRTLDTSGRLLLLQIEDRNTVGLTGDESEGDSHFRALCKDTLYSHKQHEAAGGSYGLGKSVLWSFSGLSTVLFNSVLFEDPDGCISPRLIGRAELPSHKGGRNAPGWYTGSGWFGRVGEAKTGGQRAESVWGTQAALLAGALHLDRPARSGTSILIVGFRDPASDADDGVEPLGQRIKQAAARYFWPAMSMETRRLRVNVAHDAGEQVVLAEDDELIAPFLECYRRRTEAGDDLSQPGDVALRRLAIELPDEREGEAGGSVEADLLVRLCDEGSPHPLAGHVAMFRGPGMVVRYWDRSALALGMRPFHALLVCGQARSPLAPSDGDRKLERFLRAAEPPGHDDWESTPALKQQYKRGYARALGRLKDQVTESLRTLLVARPSIGSRGPDRLQRRFPIGARGGRGGEPSAFHFTRLAARFEAERWHFAGAIRAEQNGLPWRAELGLYELGAGGEPLDRLAIERIELGGELARVQLEGGNARLDAPADLDELSFSGYSALRPAGDEPVELGLEISSVLGAEQS